jgi:hypothetical protein
MLLRLPGAGANRFVCLLIKVPESRGILFNKISCISRPEKAILSSTG